MKKYQLLNITNNKIEEVEQDKLPDLVSSGTHKPIKGVEYSMFNPNNPMLMYDVDGEHLYDAIKEGSQLLTGWQEDTIYKQRASENESPILNAMKVGVSQAADELAFGAPELAFDTLASPQAKFEKDLMKETSPVANIVGGVLGFGGNVLATGGLGTSVAKGASKLLGEKLAQKALVKGAAEGLAVGAVSALPTAGTSLIANSINGDYETGLQDAGEKILMGGIFGSGIGAGIPLAGKVFNKSKEVAKKLAPEGFLNQSGDDSAINGVLNAFGYKTDSKLEKVYRENSDTIERLPTLWQQMTDEIGQKPNEAKQALKYFQNQKAKSGVEIAKVIDDGDALAKQLNMNINITKQEVIDLAKEKVDNYYHEFAKTPDLLNKNELWSKFDNVMNKSLTIGANDSVQSLGRLKQIQQGFSKEISESTGGYYKVASTDYEKVVKLQVEHAIKDLIKSNLEDIQKGAIYYSIPSDLVNQYSKANQMYRDSLFMSKGLTNLSKVKEKSKFKDLMDINLTQPLKVLKTTYNLATNKSKFKQTDEALSKLNKEKNAVQVLAEQEDGLVNSFSKFFQGAKDFSEKQINKSITPNLNSHNFIRSFNQIFNTEIKDEKDLKTELDNLTTDEEYARQKIGVNNAAVGMPEQNDYLYQKQMSVIQAARDYLPVKSNGKLPPMSDRSYWNDYFKTMSTLIDPYGVVKKSMKGMATNKELALIQQHYPNLYGKLTTAILDVDRDTLPRSKRKIYQQYMVDMNMPSKVQYYQSNYAAQQLNDEAKQAGGIEVDLGGSEMNTDVDNFQGKQ